MDVFDARSESYLGVFRIDGTINYDLDLKTKLIDLKNQVKTYLFYNQARISGADIKRERHSAKMDLFYQFKENSLSWLFEGIGMQEYTRLFHDRKIGAEYIPFYANHKNNLGRFFTTNDYAGIWPIAEGLYEYYKYGEYLMDQMLINEHGEKILFEDWIPENNNPDGKRLSEMQRKDRLIHLRPFMSLGVSQLMIPEEELRPFFRLVKRGLNRKYDATHPENLADPLFENIALSIPVVVVGSQTERDILRELGYDIDNIDDARNRIIQLLRDSGFVVSYSVNTAWSVSIPNSESDPMRIWWDNWESFSLTPLIQNYCATHRIRKITP